MRYRAPAASGTVERLDDTLIIALGEPFAAITPGQSAVIFDDEERVLGGGRVSRAYTRTTA
jgi:tRNA U34 2-thiouridine synthase MnmA/TrmU